MVLRDSFETSELIQQGLAQPPQGGGQQGAQGWTLDSLVSRRSGFNPPQEILHFWKRNKQTRLSQSLSLV